MKMKKFALLAALAAMGLTSCQDTSYDLENIDETVKVQVKDLAVPITLEDITLEDILDIPEDSRIKQVVDPATGKKIYAIMDEGTFESEEITISEVKIPCPNINISENDVNLYVQDIISAIADDNLTLGKVKETYSIGDDVEVFTFNIGEGAAKETLCLNADNVDKSIQEVTYLAVNAVMLIKVNLMGLDEVVPSMNVAPIKLTLPKGLDIKAGADYNYDKETGELHVTKPLANGSVVVEIPVTGIDVQKAGGNLKDGKFTLSPECEAVGSVKIKVRDINKATTVGELKTLNKINFNCNLTFKDDVTITKVSGKVKYDIDVADIDPIWLGDLPDFLTDKDGESKLIFVDPRVYLAVNAPVFGKGNDKSGAEVRATLTVSSEGGNAVTASISTSKEKSYFCLSPEKKVSPMYYSFNPEEGTVACEPFEFNGLGSVLFAEKDKKSYIPSSLDLKLNANVPAADVKDFALGNFGKASVKYVFFAPLQLDGASFVKYNTTIDGWFEGDDDEKLTITSLAVEADIVGAPVGVKVDVEPIDKNKNVIPRCKGSMELKEENGHVKMEIKGNMDDINGINLSLVATANSGKVLAPDMIIKIMNLKVRVSGYYQN